MIVLSLQGFKGSSGKTTSAYHIATGLAIRGAKVLLLDTDPQAHTTEMAGLSREPAFHDFMVRNAAYKDVVRVIESEQYAPTGMKVEGRLYIIPGDEESRTIPLHISEPETLHERLQDASGNFDIVVIDTPPTPTMLHNNIYLASDAVLYPTKCEWLHFDGLIKSIEHRQRADKTRRSLGIGGVEIVGVAPTMYRANTSEHSKLLAALTAQFGDAVFEPITDAIAWAVASRKHRPVFAYKPNSRAAREAWRLVDRVQERLNAY